MKAIVERVKNGPYKGPYDVVQRTLFLLTEDKERICWHVRSHLRETNINADEGHIIEGIEITENNNGNKVINYLKSEPRVVNRQFVMF